MVNVCQFTVLKTHSVQAKMKRSIALWNNKEREERHVDNKDHQKCCSEMQHFLFIFNESPCSCCVGIHHGLHPKLPQLFCHWLLWRLSAIWDKHSYLTRTQLTPQVVLLHPLMLIIRDSPDRQLCRILTARQKVMANANTWLQHNGNAMPLRTIVQSVRSIHCR